MPAPGWQDGTGQPLLVANVGKRLVKSPKVPVRDSGIVHALLRLQTLDGVVGHPVAGAELDLVRDMGGGEGLWVVEIKRTAASSISKGMRNANKDLQPKRCFIVHAGEDRFPISKDVEAIGLRAMCDLLWCMRAGS